MGNFRVARLFGIPLELHWAFVLVPLLGAFYLQPDFSQWGSLRLWVLVLVVLLILFGCVLLHELGHALMARRFGVATKKIVLLPIGGLAMLERLPRKAGQEFWVAFAGPLVNLALAGMTLPYFIAVGAEHRLQLGRYLRYLIWPESNSFYFGLSSLDQFVLGFAALNLLIGLTNLLPAFPLDGGRMLRSLLALRLPRPQATRLAAWISQGAVILLLAWAAYHRSIDPFILFVFIFIVLSARQESRYASALIKLQGHSVRSIAQPLSTAFSIKQTLGDVFAQLAKNQRYAVIINDLGQPHGYIDLDQFRTFSSTTPLATLVKTDFITSEADDSLTEVYQEMQDQQVYVSIVTDSGQFTSWLDSGMIGQMLLAPAVAKKSTR